MDSRKIACADLIGGMQFKSEGVWWQLVRIADAGRMTSHGRAGTMTIVAKRVRTDGYVTGGSPVLVWLPITQHGVEVRPGRPEHTSVRDGRKTHRVILRPRHARDPQPYLASDGGRWSADDITQRRMIDGLAEAFESGLTA
ncbi:MAG: hypothetical protein JO057_10080 [Chloroflexi bacterium]|nr:hypothetical protein [Chloroflexota bacterium]